MPEWKVSDEQSPHAYLHYALGGVLHPATQLWQLWVTLDGKNINWVAAFRNEEKMSEVRERARHVITIGEKWNKQRAVALLNSLYEEREAEPQPMPPYIETMIRLNYTC